MTSPLYNPFIGNGGAIGPVRPTAEGHFGGLQFEDNPSHPPRDRKRIASGDYMGMERSLESVCRMIPVLTVDITPSATTPTVNYVTCANPNVTTANVTITRESVGTYVITWPSGSLPARTRRCVAHDGGSGVGDVKAVQYDANHVRVYCLINSSLVDSGPLPSIEIYGE